MVPLAPSVATLNFEIPHAIIHNPLLLQHCSLLGFSIQDTYLFLLGRYFTVGIPVYQSVREVLTDVILNDNLIDISRFKYQLEIVDQFMEPTSIAKAQAALDHVTDMSVYYQQKNLLESYGPILKTYRDVVISLVTVLKLCHDALQLNLQANLADLHTVLAMQQIPLNALIPTRAYVIGTWISVDFTPR